MTEQSISIKLNVNGRDHDVETTSRATLADVLRTELRLTGTHVNCEQGVCGVCTVNVDGLPARACLVLAAQADGSHVRTVESLAAADGTLSPLQQAFVENRGLQCGFCTPGFLMLLDWYIDAVGAPDEERIREVVGSNLCRCTGYQGIIDATMQVAEARSHASRPVQSDKR